jgi:hypothetical protein
MRQWGLSFYQGKECFHDARQRLDADNDWAYRPFQHDDCQLGRLRCPAEQKRLFHIRSFHAHTYGFLEREPLCTLSFFGEGHRQVLNWCGSHSGRDGNKAKQAGLTPLALESGGIVFQETPCGTGVPS